MILGVAGLVKGDWDNINVSVVKKVKSLGFKTLQIRVSNTESINDKSINRIKSLYNEFGLIMPQTVGDYGGGLISKNEIIRKKAIKFVGKMIAFTSKINGQNTYLRPGSLNKNAWHPHPENYSKETFDRLVDSTKKIMNIAGLNEAPKEVHDYINFLEKELETPISIVSVGPDRKQTFFR